MANKNIFRRYELKYIISIEQYHLIKKEIANYMRGDKYGESQICNLYCDTPNFLLVRRSNEKPFYKEKLRIRSYGVATPDSEVFVEIKKKFDSVVYKRRIATLEKNVADVFAGKVQSQIAKEIAYFTKLYPGIQPRMFVSYRREAFYGMVDKNFRITFDRSLLWRISDLTLTSGIYGQHILPEDKVLMEIKTATAVPLWLVKILSENKIYKTSFSKYGTAYTQMLTSVQEIQQKSA